MASTLEFKYYVVELLTSPPNLVPRFVAIPSSWIRSPPLNKKAPISYPTEKSVATYGRILSGETFNSNWPIHLSNIKFGCDDLNEAQNYARERCKELTEQPLATEPGAKRAVKRSMTVDSFQSYDIPKKKKSVEETPKKSNPDNKLKTETLILKRLRTEFNGIYQSFDSISDTLNETLNSINKIKSTMKHTEQMTNDYVKVIDCRKRNSEKRSRHCSKRCGDSDQQTEEKNQQKNFIFPDNSDTNSKWTVRYREYEEGLVELLPKSGVYVRKVTFDQLGDDGYNRIITLDDLRAAARILMKDIFSDHALRVCTLSGGKKSKDNSQPNNLPPGLDDYSRKVLIMFLEECCVLRGWDWEEEKRRVLNTLRNKLLEYRHHGDQNVR